MKKYKKFWAVLLTLAMVLGMSMTTMAAEPSNADEKSVTVQNLESGVTVTAYQFIKANYNKENNGFTGYEWVVDGDAGVQAGDAVTIKEGKTDEVVGLTSDFITELAVPEPCADALKRAFRHRCVRQCHPSGRGGAQPCLSADPRHRRIPEGGASAHHRLRVPYPEHGYLCGTEGHADSGSGGDPGGTENQRTGHKEIPCPGGAGGLRGG